jgi:3-oxoacyl-[acyl-carrier-protein] synthase-3
MGKWIDFAYRWWRTHLFELTMYILGTGHFHPETIIDNLFLESLDIATSHEWIFERVGIRERRTVLPLDYISTTHNQDIVQSRKAATYSASELGQKAASMALERAGITSKEVGLIIAGSCLPEMSIPAQACLIGAKLGIEAPAYDLNAACSSFMAQVDHLCSMQLDRLPNYILIVIPETITLATNYKDRTTAVLWGDGAAAALLSPRIKGRAQIVASTFGSRPAEYDKVSIPYGGYFTQQGAIVQKFAITQTETTIKKLLSEANIPPEKTFFIGHQANLLMLQNCSKRIGITPEKHLFNVDRFGNQGAAGAPAVLSQSWDQFKSGDILAMAAVGSGLSWGGILVKFQD